MIFYVYGQLRYTYISSKSPAAVRCAPVCRFIHRTSHWHIWKVKKKSWIYIYEQCVSCCKRIRDLDKPCLTKCHYNYEQRVFFVNAYHAIAAIMMAPFDLASAGASTCLGNDVVAISDDANDSLTDGFQPRPSGKDVCWYCQNWWPWHETFG